ncbi:histidine phosphatase superfamily [Trichoderma ceciliae]
MPPTIDHSIPDPRLTDLGIQQCAQLRLSLVQRFSSFQGRIAVVASPMVRTLQTMHLICRTSLHANHSLRLTSQIQPRHTEISDHPCDTGSPLPLLKDNHAKHQFSPHSFDFSSVNPLWPDKTSSPAARNLFGYTRSAVLRRGRRCLEKLSRRPEDLIFVFSHSAFLRMGVTGWWYFNADYRVFTFEEALGGGGLGLKMDESTLKGGMGWSWPKRVELGSEIPEGVEEEN